MNFNDLTVNAIEIVSDRLYWISDKIPPQSKKEAYYFCIDNVLEYNQINFDFGPLNISCIHSFCEELDKLVKNPNYRLSKIFHYCSEDYKKKANAALLICAYQILYLNRTPKKAWEQFASIKFVSFRDCLKMDSTYNCTILHCLQALYFASKIGWYNFKTFDATKYNYYSKVENGDINWIIPYKFIAFSTPIDNANSDIKHNFSTDFYIPIFKLLNVKLIVCLTRKEYDNQKFINAGINVVDLYFPDGTTPSEVIQIRKLCSNF